MNRDTTRARGILCLALAAMLAAATGCQPSTPEPGPPTPTTVTLPTATPIPARPEVPFTPVAGEEPAPIVVQRAPEAGERLGTGGAIQVTFDRPMNHASVEAAWQIQPKVQGDLSWVDARTVRFQPDAPLERGATYDVAFTQEARDEAGLPLREPYQFRFQTQGHLEVGQTIPADGARDIRPDTIVTVMFNRPVVPLTTLQQRDTLPQPLRIDPPVEGEYEWLNTSILVFRPAQPLPGGTIFTARIAAGLADTDGNPLAADYVWTFSTEAPRVLSVSPDPRSERRAPIETPIVVRFNQLVDAPSARAALSVRGRMATVLTGTSEVLGDTLVFTPGSRLDFDASHTVRVAAGVKSASGGGASTEEWTSTFQTVPLPRIVGTRPADGDRDVSYGWPFMIEFNTPMDWGTVMEHVKVSPPISPAQVYTYYSDWDNSFGLYFSTQPASDYVVEISPGIADPYGNLTRESLRVAYRTRNAEPYAFLTAPGGVSTLNARLPARLVATSINVRWFDLELSTLDQADVRYLTGQPDEFDRVAQRRVRQWRQAIDGQPNRPAHTRIDLAEGGGPLAPGVYLLHATTPDIPRERFEARLLLVVSEINLVLKMEPAGGLVWAMDMQTGQPVAGLPVRLYNASYGDPYEITELGQGVTGSDGVARVAVQAPTSNRYYDAVLAVTDADSPRFAAVSSQWSSGVNSYDFDIPYDGYSQSTGPAVKAFLYTDRPIYRPGQMVYFRGIVRADDDARYSALPAGAQANVWLNDASGNKIYDQVLPVDEYGAFSGQVLLPEGASLGGYSVFASIDQSVAAYASFTVSNYRPPEFEVTVEAATAEMVRGEALPVTVTARYLSGGALRGATAQWNVLASRAAFDPPQLDQYTFADYDNPWTCYDCWYYRNSQPPPVPLDAGSGTTDEQGRLTLSLPIGTELRDRAGGLISGPVSLSIEANVTGADNQYLAGRTSVLVHPADHYLGIALTDYILKAGRATTVELVAVDWQGQRLPGAEFEVLMYRREWKNTYDEATGRWSTETIDELISAEPVVSDASGEARAILTPPEAGSYRIVARGADRDGHQAQSSRFAWATGSEHVSWMRENNDRITLIADKTTFLPGETARILIPSPFEGEHYALVTVERGHILQHELIRIAGSAQVYELPISASFVPNVYVSVVLFKGMPSADRNADFKIGYASLRVEPVRQVVSVTLTPDRALVQPGETVNYTLQVVDSDGKPVAGQFSLDLVDKGILNLMPRPVNEIVEAFYGTRGLNVQTASGLVVSANRLTELREQDVLQQAALDGDATRVAEAPAAAMPSPSATAAPEMAKGGAANTGPEPAVRENFADTAFWSPDITTDPDGRASVAIALPDNLTTWVLRAVGIDAGARVGEGAVNVVATKPLLIRPVAPRFLTVGDVVELGAVVNNNTDAPQAAQVWLSAAGITLTTDVTLAVTIPAQGEATVAWRAVVGDAPQADLVFGVRSAEYADASKPRLSTAPNGGLKINRYSAPEVVGTAGDLDAAGSRTEVIALPPDLDTTQGELTVRLDPSLAASMQAGLTYLENYPYESADLIVSRFLPNVLTYRALSELGISNPALADKLAGLVRESMDKLAALQNDDGGWSWWRDGTSSVHITAYVVYGLARAREAGFDAPADALERGLTFLEGALAETAALRHYYEFNRQAWLLHVLGEAGRPATARVDELYDQRDHLGLYARALLALTIGRQNGGDARLKTLFADLNGRVVQSATGAHWEEQYVDWWAMNTDTRSTAIVLSALAQYDPDNALAPNVVRWLMASRVDGIWRTTQENAWTLIALTDWMKATGELKADYAYAAQLNGAEIAAGRATPDTITQTAVARVPVADLLRDVGNRLLIGRGEGPGRLYYTAHLRAYLPVPTIRAADRGIQVSRRYVMASCQDGPRCPEVTRAKVGDVIRVELSLIAPSELYYVQLEDPLPAGAEVVDTGLATTSQLAQAPGLTRQDSDWWYGWWWHWYSRSELRDDRVALFADYLSKGAYEYSYTLRVTTPGQFNVIPTFVNQQYFPEVFGRGDGMLFTVSR